MKRAPVSSDIIDRRLCPSLMDEPHRSTVPVALQSSTRSTILDGTGLSMAAHRPTTLLRTVGERTGLVATGHWTHTPKFGDFDHFQRWRCLT